MTIAFLDTETTGLDPARHEVWEIGLIIRDHRRADWNGEWSWQLPVDLSRAEPTALRLNRYYERISELVGPAEAWMPYKPDDAKTISEIGELSRTPGPGGVGRIVTRLLDRALIVGANPGYDAAFIAAFLRRHAQAEAWDYHLRDIGSMAAGYAAATIGRADDKPLPLDEAAEMLDVAVADQDDRHAALGDARFVARLYDAMISDNRSKELQGNVTPGEAI